jgi:hypothetical protein
MTKKTFTKVRKWAEEKGYKVEETYAYGDKSAIKITVDEENSFKCEEQDSTIYMSIRGQKGNPGGLYLTHIYKPKDGKYYRNHAFHKRSQKEMIEDMESDIKKYVKVEEDVNMEEVTFKEEDNMENKVAKEITVEDYNDLAQNGARTLFDIGMYRVIDGLKDEERSYFIKDFDTNKWYLIDMVTCYELVTAFHCGGSKTYIEDCLYNIIDSAN